MPALLRTRISCFYCNARTDYTKTSAPRQFTCLSCEATNFLDNAGNITDVPATAFAHNEHAPRYVKTPQIDSRSVNSNANLHYNPAFPPTSTTPQNDPESLFCATCLRNQHFLTACLADYLPPDSDPQYPQFEAAYPEYKLGLERRYPPVCIQCEPRVRAQLKKTARVAQTDVLEKRLIARNGIYAVPYQSWSARDMGLRVVVWAIWCALGVQILWHLLGVFGLLGDRDIHRALTAGQTFLEVGRCVGMLARIIPLSTECSTALDGLVKKSILISCALSWYNHTMSLGTRGIRYAGQQDYYVCHFIVLAARALSYFALTVGIAGQPDPIIARACHVFMLILVIMGTIFSRQSIRPIAAPRLVLDDASMNLVDKESYQNPALHESPSQASSVRPQRQSGLPSLFGKSAAKRFHIEQLAPLRQPSISTMSTESGVASLPSPPASAHGIDERLAMQTDQDMGDSMDWEPVPVQSTYNLRSRSQSPAKMDMPSRAAGPTAFGLGASNTQNVKSPFYGKLPPAPKSLEHRLRNQARVAPQPRPEPAPLAEQRDWFQKLRPSAPGFGSGVRFQTNDAEDAGSRIGLQPSKWTLQRDQDLAVQGTGLEDLFGTSFNIRDPYNLDRTSEVADRGGLGMKLIWPVAIACIVAIVALLLSASSHAVSDTLQLFLSPTQSVLGASVKETKRLFPSQD